MQAFGCHQHHLQNANPFADSTEKTKTDSDRELVLLLSALERYLKQFYRLRKRKTPNTNLIHSFSSHSNCCSFQLNKLNTSGPLYTYLLCDWFSREWARFTTLQCYSYWTDGWGGGQRKSSRGQRCSKIREHDMRKRKSRWKRRKAC